jgi:hypothetical protein
MIDDQLSFAIESARAAAQRGDFASAVETQERVVLQARLKAQAADDLLTLGVQMFNLADYYTGMERWDDAIRLMEEVVALDEKIGHPDVESDRQMLEQVRRLAGMTPEARKQFYSDTPQSEPTVSYLADPVKDLLAQINNVSNEERAELEQLMREMSGLSPEEQVKRVMEVRGKQNRE